MSSSSRQPSQQWAAGLALGAACGVGCAFAVCSPSFSAHFAPRFPHTDPQFLDELRQIAGPGNVSTDPEELEEYGRDKWSYHSGTRPNVVVRARAVEQVQAIVRLCAAHKMPVIPYGSGTSLEGHTTAPEGGVVLDLSVMDDVLRVNHEDMDVVVQPGISYNELNARLKSYGLFFPVDPGPGASIGGMVSTGCSGTNAVRYGTMKQNVLALKVVLPDGTLVKTAQRARKTSAGYDLTSLFVGSEGTLGVVVEATLRLQPIPQASAVAVCAFEDVGDACRAVGDLMRQGTQVQCVELLDDVMMRAVNMNSGLSYAEKPHLFFRFSGTPAQVEDASSRVSTTIRKYNGGSFQWERDPSKQERLWEARKVALWAAQNMREGCKVWTTDVCVPISRLAESVSSIKADIRASTLTAPIVGHAGDGNFHVFFLLDESKPEELQEAIQLNRRMVHRAIDMSGTCTGEHGVGVGKKEFLTRELGEPNVALMRRLKTTLDPLNIMNPGKLVPEKRSSTIVAASDGGLRPAWTREGQCC